MDKSKKAVINPKCDIPLLECHSNSLRILSLSCILQPSS